MPAHKKELVTVTPIAEEGEDLSMFGSTASTNHATAYDGELNPMTFNHVKSSKAFEKKHPLFDISTLEGDDEYDKWFSNLQQNDKPFSARKSEDGWGKKNRALFGGSSASRKTEGSRLNHAVSF